MFNWLYPPPATLPPVDLGTYQVIHQPRTLRDECAMSILPAVLTTYEKHCRDECVKGGNGSIHDIAANIAYAYADAMIKARES